MMTSTPPPSDHGWSDPAASQAPTSGTAYPAAAAAEPRPGRVTWGSITLIVLGALTLLFGLLALLGGAFLTGGAANGLDESAGVPPGFEGMAGAFGGILIVIAIVVLVLGGVQIWAAVKALAGRNWARITGIVLAAIIALLNVVGLLGSLGANQAGQPQAGGGGIIINVVILAAYAFVIFAYATSGRWFNSRST